MMRKKEQLSIEAKSKDNYCLICLQVAPVVTPTISVKPKVKDALASTSTSTSLPPPFQAICQYLKLSEEWEQSELFGGGSLSLSLCEGCTKLSERFSEHYLELKELKMRVKACLKSVYERMVKAEEDQELLVEFRRSRTSLGKRRVPEGTSMKYGDSVKRLRRETLERCARKLNKFQILQAQTEAVMKESVLTMDNEDRLPNMDTEETENDDVVKEEPDEFENLVQFRDEDNPEDSESEGHPSTDPLGLPDPETSSEVKQEATDDDEYGDDDETPSPRCPPSPITVAPPTLKSKSASITGKKMYTKLPGAGKYRCRLCPREFQNIGSFNVHYQGVHEGIKYKCSQCPKVFPYRASYNLHFQRDHLKIRHKCSTCHKLFSLRSTLNRHRSTCDPNATDGEICRLCGKKFPRKLDVLRHLRRVHSPNFKAVGDEVPKSTLDIGTGKHQCGICFKQFTSEYIFQEHYATLHLQKKSTCAICNLPFNSRKALWTHNQKVHKGEEFRCQKCKEVFADSGTLREHQLTSCSGGPRARPKCEICGKDFNRARQLRLHVKTVHLKLREYLCNQCGKGFTTNKTLSLHLQNAHSQSEAQEHICEQCGKQFGGKGSLKSHRNKAHGGKKMGRK